MKRFYCIAYFMICCVFVSFAQNNQIPTVFQTGTLESEFEQLVTSHNTMLLSVCDNSMDKAYLHWTDMLRDVEKAAEERDYDIKGVKIWINAFWNKDGGIDHLVFYPKPTSKNIDYKAFEEFLDEVAPQLHIDLYAEQGYSHYGSASFPIYHRFNKTEGN